MLRCLFHGMHYYTYQGPSVERMNEQFFILLKFKKIKINGKNDYMTVQVYGWNDRKLNE